MLWTKSSSTSKFFCLFFLGFSAFSLTTASTKFTDGKKAFLNLQDRTVNDKVIPKKLKGLVILIDFSDAPANVFLTRADSIINGLNYTEPTVITNSMKENKVSDAAITTFLAMPEVSYTTGTSTHLTKIGTQKYISLFKQSVEAWSEARRTDIPLMTGVSQNYAASHNRPPFRMSYADQERTLNPDNFPSYVKVVDIFWGDQMWWDTRTGIK